MPREPYTSYNTYTTMNLTTSDSHLFNNHKTLGENMKIKKTFPEYYQCNFCGKQLTLDNPHDIIIIHKQNEAIPYLYSCKACFHNSKNFTMCFDCGNICLTSGINKITQYNASQEKAVCPQCMVRYKTCNICEKYYVPRSQSDRDRGLCPSCAPKDVIHEYNYKPGILNFYPEPSHKNLFLGLEVELECKQLPRGVDREDLCFTIAKPYNPRYIAYQLQEKFDKKMLHFYIKRDGSLINGFEIVTHPMTLNYHKNNFPWDDILAFLIENKCKSYNTETCGLHIHANKNFMCSNGEEIKLGLFIDTQKENFVRLARRENTHYANFKTIFPGELRYANTNSNRKYEAVNWSNTHTVEFRMFKGTLKKESIFAIMELVDATIKFCRMTSTAIIMNPKVWDKFCDYIINNTNVYRYLPAYLKFCNALPLNLTKNISSKKQEIIDKPYEALKNDI